MHRRIPWKGINFDVPIISFRVNAGNASIDPRSTEWSRSTRETAPLVANKSGPNKTVAWTVVPASGVLLHGGGAVVGKKKLLGTKVRVVWPL